MLCHAWLRFRVGEEEARILAESLKPDDPEWCKSYASGEELVVEIETQKIESLINACDDYFKTIKSGMTAIDAAKV
ncbi:KEOPS complex subunit Pcc1 [Archaeoglobus veneficus]|uniref:Uncharacterized protein n=1 Tax=Archaeoglobus veneficus (strain DSM 11195 / SNP6) TaxID=693661 RepID=F2KP46_ARCVS|nr:KEOPS complex subunit Pcc1 [Archaeoglobus veneficus]AEA46354.1 hypothetical protein Arcve_0320 [Archaeoglobus veneficus SNP6]